MKVTQRQRAYRHIRNKIAGGALPAGERVSAAALAREIGVSHIPVREAIGQLQSEGFVVHIAHRGAFVKGADRLELVDLIELRTLLECNAAAQAARRISAARLKELDDRWLELCQAAEAFHVPPGTDMQEPLRKWLLADLAFHMTLLRAAGNRRVIRVIQDARAMTYMFGYRTDDPVVWSDPPAFVAEGLRVHRDIYKAVCQRDAKAARRTMAAHMRRAGKNLLARFDRLERGELGPAREGRHPSQTEENQCGEGIYDRFLMVDMPLTVPDEKGPVIVRNTIEDVPSTSS